MKQEIAAAIVLLSGCSRDNDSQAQPGGLIQTSCNISLLNLSDLYIPEHLAGGRGEWRHRHGGGDAKHPGYAIYRLIR